MSGTQLPRKCPSDAGCNNVKSLFQEVGYNKSISLLNGESTIERGCKQNRIKKIVLTKRKIKRNVNKNQESIPASIPAQRRSTAQQKLNLEDSHFSNARWSFAGGSPTVEMSPFSNDEKMTRLFFSYSVRARQHHIHEFIKIYTEYYSQYTSCLLKQV